jgi:hypothetical protein
MTWGRKPYTRPEPLVAKAQTRRLDDKGPDRNGAWLARVRSLPCLCCPHGRQTTPTRPHHPKGLFPRTIGKRISDLLCLPACDWHHTDGPTALHRYGNELNWWRSCGVDPYGAILSQLAQCRDPDRDEAIAFVKLHRERAAA